MPQHTHEITAWNAKKHYMIIVAPSTAAPTVITAPYASSTGTTLGSVCSCTQGNWTNEPTSYTYQWKRAGVNISGATLNQYTLQAADHLQAITCQVTAINAAGSNASTSNAIAASFAASSVDEGKSRDNNHKPAF
jgi:hypothetical protein